jgi:hypothetical protein
VAEEVARQVAPLREEYERKTRQAEQLINDKAEQEIALRMVRRFAVREVAAVERTDDNQIIRVSRAVTIGDDVYVYFTVQNRDAAAYALKAVRVTQSGGEIPARVVIENPSGKDAGALVGTVPPGRTSAGLVIIPMAKLAPGRAVQVEWVQGGRGKSVALTFRID